MSPVVDPTSGTIKVTVEVTDHPPTARPGDFAEVRIVTDRQARAVLVPRTAVLSDEGERIVSAAAVTTAQRRTVEVGFPSSPAPRGSSGRCVPAAARAVPPRP